jgi:hypothetical protein
MTDIILGVLIVVPALLTFFLKSNGGVVFLSVCAGYVMAIWSGNEVANLLSGTNFKVRNTDVDLLFLFLPMAFSVFMTARAVSGKSKTIMHAVAAAGAGAVFVITGTPFINLSLHLNLSDTKIWPVLSSAQAYIVGIGVIYSLILMWFFSKPSNKKHKK